MVAEEKLNLYDVASLQLDENDNWIRPEYPRYKAEIAPAKPFLVPSFDNEVVEILPSVKQNRKINFDDHVYVMEIENRFQMLLTEDQVEEEDEVSYEIEIVEGGQTDDADFYLEMIDGEIFYVFETEDDISVEEGENEESSESETSESDDQSQAQPPMQLDIGGMMAPNLNESFRSQEGEKTSDTSEEDDDDEDAKVDNMDFNEVHTMIQPQVQFVFENESKSDGLISLSIAAPTSTDTSKSTSPTTTDVAEMSKEDTENNQQQQELQSEKIMNQNVPPQRAKFGDAHRKEQEKTSNAAEAFSPLSPTRPSTTDATDMNSPQASVRSILKACPPSPKTKSPKQSRKEKKVGKESKKKTFTKTYVRADDFDGEHRVYAWEKPAWAANNTLRKSGKGDAILKGENLAQPITDKEKILMSGKVKWERPEWAKQEEDEAGNDEGAAKDELIRKIQEGSLNLPSKRKGGGRLKITLNGSTLREGSDIVKPITKATVVKKPSNVNTVANPKILRATPIGQKLKEGVSLEAPTTAATQLKKYQFERPSWTQIKLQSTQAGDILKKGGDVALAITPATVEQNSKSKDDWRTKRGIGRMASASIVLEDSKRKEYAWEKPSWAQGIKLRKTPKGDAARSGEGLARPITNLPHLGKKTETTHDDNTSDVSNGSSSVPRTDSSEKVPNEVGQQQEEPQRRASADDVKELQGRENESKLRRPPRSPRRRTPLDPSIQRSKSLDL